MPLLHLVRWSFILGVACAAIAVTWRGLMTLGYLVPEYIAMGRTIYDMSFYKGALLLLLISLAGSSYGNYRERYHAAQRRHRQLAEE